MKTSKVGNKKDAEPTRAASAEESTIPTREDLIRDLLRVQGEFPDATVSRNIYRKHGKYKEDVWSGQFPRFADFRRAAGLSDSVEAAKEEVTERVEFSGDTCEVNIKKTRIHTLDELIEYCEIDLDVWEVERFTANKWEMGYIQSVSKTTTGKKSDTETSTSSRTADAIPLYQVKAYLRRKRHADTEGYVQENALLRAQVEKLKIKVRMESELTRRLAQNHFGMDDFMAGIAEVSKSFSTITIPPTQIDSRIAKSSPVLSVDHTEDAVLLISDTHYGERIRIEDTAGFQEVNLITQGNRTGRIARGAKEILTIHRSVYPIDTLHVWIGGDIGNGALHAAALSNSINEIEQVHFSANMLRFLIRDLLELTVPDKRTKRVVVRKINLLLTVGNHMRIDEKMPYNLQARRTLDWLIYQILIDEFKDHPNVTIQSDLAPFIFQNIRGHRFMFCHGFQVGYQNSPDAQIHSVKEFMTRARALFDSRQWRKENGLEGETFTHACIGDIHVPLEFPRFTSNASLSGQNSLGANWMLEPIPAGMQIFGVSEKHTKTWKYFIEVTHVGADDMNAYGEFAQKYQVGHNA